MGRIIFKKIKVDKYQKPTLIYDRELFEGRIEEGITLNGAEASEEIARALNTFGETVVNLLDLGDEWNTDAQGRVSGISMKHLGAGQYGLTITLQRNFEDDEGAYAGIVNSPYISYERQTRSDEISVIALVNAAEDYVNSQPVQTSLLEQPEEAIANV